MRQYSALNWLVPLIAVLALSAALAGLIWQGGEGRYSFTTHRGQTTEIYGQGLYRNDTVFSAATFKAVDLVTLLVALPVLIISFRLYRRGSLKGGLLLAGTLSFFLYNGASMAFGAAFNPLFLIYTAIFSASLFSFILVLTAFDVENLPAHISPRLPHRGLAVFLFIAGLGTFGLWLSEMIGPILENGTPALLGPYTTMYSHGFDSAVITPACVLTGICLLRRKPLGYLLAAPLLILCIFNGINVLAATASQTLAGITFPIGTYIGMIGTWVVMGAFAIGLAISFFRNFSDTPTPQKTNSRSAASRAASP